MNAPLTRRALLGATAAIGVTTLPATALTAASPAGTMSPEAAVLLREFHDIAGRFNAAGILLDKTMMATDRVPEPEALFARGQDFWILGCIAPKRHWDRQRFTYGQDELIEQLRALPAGDGDRRRANRRDEIVGAWDEWEAAKEAARDASGETAASDHYRTVGDEHDALLLRLTHMRTADPDIMRIKAAAVLNIWSGDADRFDSAVNTVLKGDGDSEDPLCFSLMRDFMHQLGAEYRVAS